MKVQESFFQLTDYLIEESRIKISKTSLSKVKYQLELNPSISEIKEETDYLNASVTLEVIIRAKEGRRCVRNIYVKITGNFRATKSIKKELFNSLLRINGVMNLLIISRSYIASVTSQMGIAPVIIPMVNLLQTPIK